MPTTIFAEHAAFQSLIGSAPSATEDEAQALKGCSFEAKRRGAFGAGFSCIAAQLCLSSNPFRAASIGLTLVGTVVGGYAAGISSVRPCLKTICALEDSLMALETRRLLHLHAPSRSVVGALLFGRHSRHFN